MANTILQIRSNGQITLPAVLRREANLNEGDVLEVLSPEGYFPQITASGMLDTDGNPIVSTPRAEMTYYLPVPAELPVYTFLSRAGDKDRSVK